MAQYQQTPAVEMEPIRFDRYEGEPGALAAGRGGVVDVVVSGFVCISSSAWNDAIIRFCFVPTVSHWSRPPGARVDQRSCRPRFTEQVPERDDHACHDCLVFIRGSHVHLLQRIRIIRARDHIAQSSPYRRTSTLTFRLEPQHRFFVPVWPHLESLTNNSREQAC